MWKSHKLIISSLLLSGLILLIGCLYYHRQTVTNPNGLVAVTTISSDGHYVFTTDSKHYAILWDLQHKKKTIISHDAELYSAYWIKNTPYFMWQDQTAGKVSIENVNTLKVHITMEVPYMIFGQAMSSDLEYYVFSDANWTVFVKHGELAKIMVKNYDDVPGFEGGGKLINFTFLGNDKLLTSGLTYSSPEDPSKANGVDLWDLTTRKKIHRYIGNGSKTFATLSPNGKYVLAGDEGGTVYAWDTLSGEPFLAVDSIFLGNMADYERTSRPDETQNDKKSSLAYLKKWHLEKAKDDENQIIKPPADFAQSDGFQSNAVLSLKFIDPTHYLRFTTYIPYAILYSITDPKPIKYFDLGKHPMPSISYYERDQSIDTSPSAHILVMGKDTKPGILVYQYDPDKQTLTKIADLE